MYSRAGQAARTGLSAITDFILSGGKPAAAQVQRLLPALEMSGSRTLRDAGRRAAVRAGLTDELTAFPSVVSQQGGNLGLLGIRQSLPSAAPTPAGLNPALRGFTGQANVGALSPEMQAIIRAAEQSKQVTPSAPGVRGVPSLAQNRPPVPLAEAPQPPVRYPEPARGETARQITMLKPGEGEVGSMGTRLTYRPGTQGVDRRLGSTTYGEGVELGASSAYPRMPAGSSAQEQMRLSSQLNRGGSSAELPGTPLLRTRGDNQYVAPRPAFGREAAGEVLDPSIGDVVFRGGEILDPSVTDLLFGGSRGGGGTGARVAQGGRGGALVRSPGGEMVDELMIDPVFVREIFERAPELVGAFRNAAGGVQTADLGNILSNRALLAALGAAGLGAAGYGAASFMGGGSQDRTGETTAQAPTIPARPLFTEDGATPLGDGAAPIAPATAPGPGVIDPSAASPSPAAIVTSGGDQRKSAVREALSQFDPAAAAVMRATEALPPEKYTPERGGIAKYYADRAAYAQQAPVRKELVEMMRGMQTERSGDLAAWAEKHPALAYEIQRRQLANPAANQQSAESITTTTVTTPMGSETAANAVGASEAARNDSLNPSQSTKEMVDATRMQLQPNLQRVQDFIQRQAPRSRMYAGY